MAMVMVTRKAEMTQLMWSTPPSSPTMVGSAVEKIIWPRELINMVRTRAEKIRPRLLARALPSAGATGSVVATIGFLSRIQ